MNLDCLERDGTRYLAGKPGEAVMQAAKEAVDLVGACFECKAAGALLYPENLPPGFADLSTGVAGEVLLKLQLYRIRLAVVMPLETTEHSAHFAAMVREANRGRDFHVAPTRDEAEAWLLKT